jgi:type IV secretion system protein VirB9
MRTLSLLAVGLTLSACAARNPPALPEEPTVFEQPASPAPAEQPTRQASEPAPAALEPIVTPTPEEWQAFTELHAPDRPERPASVIEEANDRSRMAPSRRGYANGHSSLQRYPYRPGTLYEIYSSPNHPTTILLPPGERLAAAPTLNPDAWNVGVAEMGSDGTRQEAVIVRPVAPGLEATTPLLTQSGRVFFCRLRSFQHTSMVAVTWEVPLGRPFPLEPGKSGTLPATPMVDISRLHTAYLVEQVKGNPPWFPLAVYDDGSKTVMHFKASLRYTNAPAVFVRHADGRAGVVEFTPYDVPDAPEKGAYYLVQGLWPQLELRGSDGQVVRITRTTGQPQPYRAGKANDSIARQ